jgi:demethylmenaquinone methyltransferase/2-methoxy-6-polyprenyl-1,4-benzoquinol methylase
MHPFFNLHSLSDKKKYVHNVFQNVASQYDIMNDFMSLGTHRLWKQQFVQSLPLSANLKILDVAGGTGDISRQIHNAYPYYNLDITVCDLSENMVIQGRNKSYDRGINSIQWVVGDGMNLPIHDHSMDVYVISFGLRNIPDIKKALIEAKRVLKPHGHFSCLEFSPVDNTGPFQKIYNMYSDYVIPMLGRHVAHDEESYSYLVESIRNFPSPNALKALMEEVGFQNVTFKSSFKGIFSHHQGTTS